MRPCSVAGSYFAPTPFRSPVGEWHVTHLPAPLKNASPGLRVADDDVEDLVEAAVREPSRSSACRNVARSATSCLGQVELRHLALGPPDLQERAELLAVLVAPARGPTASGPVRPPRRARWSRGRSRTGRRGTPSRAARPPGRTASRLAAPGGPRLSASARAGRPVVTAAPVRPGWRRRGRPSSHTSGAGGASWSFSVGLVSNELRSVRPPGRPAQANPCTSRAPCRRRESRSGRNRNSPPPAPVYFRKPAGTGRRGAPPCGSWR